MKKNRVKLIIILLAVAFSLSLLYPTYKDYNYTQQIKKLSGQDSANFIGKHEKDILASRLKRVKLGLDLQGGMRVVLEVNVPRFLRDMARNKDENFEAVMKEIDSEIVAQKDELIIDIFKKVFENKGIRLSRYYGKSIRESDVDILKQLKTESEKAIDRAMEVVHNRVDQYGVSEPTIQKQGNTRIIVELPGVSNEKEVQQLLQGTALLEFKLLKDSEICHKIMENVDNLLRSDTALIKTILETTDASTRVAMDTTIRSHPFLFLARPNPSGGSGTAYVAEDNKAKVKRILARDDVKRILPNDVSFQWSAKSLFTDTKGVKYFELFILKAAAELTGSVITDARMQIGTQDNQPEVSLEMNGEGAHEWARITGANVNKRIAIVMDSVVYSAPRVINKITGGRSSITGIENVDEARLLEIVLRAGALPAPVDIIESRSVGPSLGEDSIRAGVNSTLMAFIFTALFMIVYYMTGGIVADVALAFNILFILGVLAGFQSTLTLPGIAGIILTFATSVDANVLIYERIREETKGGKTLIAAIDAGYNRALSAILDSNITTFLIGVIMYQFGTGPVQGFALTLMIGIASSLFSALIITRVIFNIMTERGVRSINFG